MNDKVPSTLGLPIRIRRVDRDDVERLRRFYSELSTESRRRRFLSGGSEVDAHAATYLCGPDHLHREGFVAVPVGSNAGRIVGHLCLEPSGPRQAEVAVAVSDVEQGHGIGRLLMTEALLWAAQHGIERFTATCAVDNEGILRLVRALGLPITFGPMAGGTQELSIALSTDRRPQQVAA